MKLHCSEQELIQNLRDAGCDEQAIQIFLDSLYQGKSPESIRQLKKHRRCLLDNVHTEQKKIDCLDYLLYQMQKSANS